MADQRAVGEAVAALTLVDHHVHQALGGGLSRDGFEGQITESDRLPPAGTTQFDSQLGFAVRRWCAPAATVTGGACFSAARSSAWASRACTTWACTPCACRTSWSGT